MKTGMESGPVALKGSSPLRILCTSFQFTAMAGISRYGLGPLSGNELVSSLVATEWN